MVINSKKTITDFDTNISVSMPMDLMAPTEILTVEDYTLVKNMFDITNKYKNNTWIDDMSLIEMSADLLHLQALQISNIERFGVLSGYADSIEDQLKIARSKIRINAKALKQKYEDNGDSVSVTLDDLKDLSYTKTEEIWYKLSQAKIAADFVKSVYYAIRDHVTMLNATIQRLSKVEPI